MLKTLKKLRIINSWRHSKFYELWANITPENLSRLVAKGVNLNEPIKGENLPYGSKGMTAFHFLCWFQNDINTLKKAIELGADGSRTSNHGYTALMYYLDDDKLDGPEHPYNDFEKYWVSMPGSGGEIKLETCQFLVKNGSSLNHQSKAYCRRLYNDIGSPPITDKNQGGIHTLFLILRENQFALLEDLLKTNPDPTLS